MMPHYPIDGFLVKAPPTNIQIIRNYFAILYTSHHKTKTCDNYFLNVLRSSQHNYSIVISAILATQG